MMRKPPGLALAVWMLGAAVLTSCSPPFEHEVWTYRTHRPFLPGESEMFGPVFAGDQALVCGGYGWDRECRLAALNPLNGKSQWEHVIGWAYAPPIVAGNIAVGFGTLDHSMTIKAVDIHTGTLRWEQSLRKVFSWRPALQQGAWIYLHDGYGAALCFDAASGSSREIALPERMRKPGVRDHWWGAADERRAILGCGAEVYLLEPESATARLLTTLERRVGRLDRVVLHGDVIHVAENRHDRQERGRLWAFDLGTGRMLWERRWRRVFALKVLGDCLYANVLIDREWVLMALDPLTGQERWRADVKGTHPPLLRNGRLYVDDSDWRFLAFRVAVVDSATGKVILRRSVENEIMGTPVIDDDKLFYGTIAGELHAVRVPQEP
jgi:outer membrane protein assembly factor BamB